MEVCGCVAQVQVQDNTFSTDRHTLPRMESIHSLEYTSLRDIYIAWQAAFAGYERSWTEGELQADLIRRGYNASLSFGAFSSGQLIGFVLNGIGDFQGLPTAYDTGTGTVPQARGRGLTKKIFEASLPCLKEAGIVRYVLEVLQQNEPAIAVYKSLGFGISRELAYFIEDVSLLPLRGRALPPGIRIAPVPVTDLQGLQEMWDAGPTWQNTLESIRRRPDVFVAVGALEGGKMIGYGVIDPSSGDIPQIAVERDRRRRGVGGAVLEALIQQNKKPTVKLINVETTCDSLLRFLASYGIKEKGRQYEMAREIV